MFTKHAAFIFISALICSSNVLADKEENKAVKVNRYSNAIVKPSYDQKDLLSVIIQLRFPKGIQKIGQAVSYLLKNSGYQLDETHIDDSQYFLYDLPLPEAHRQLGPITLKSALQVLGNSGFDLVINPVKRTISYKLNKQFLAYINNEDIESAKVSWVAQLHNKNQGGTKEKVTVSAVFIPENNQYGAIKRGESLSSISRSLNIYGISIEQVMIAIYQQNPKAFMYQNINLILEGSILTIPKLKEIEAIPFNLAADVVREHHKKWKLLINRKVGDK